MARLIRTRKLQGIMKTCLNEAVVFLACNKYPLNVAVVFDWWNLYKKNKKKNSLVPQATSSF